MREHRFIRGLFIGSPPVKVSIITTCMEHICYLHLTPSSYMVFCSMFGRIDRGLSTACWFKRPSYNLYRCRNAKTLLSDPENK